MTDEVKAAEAAAEIEKVPFVEPAPPSRDERILAVVRDLEHAMKHNAPIAIATLAEVKDLLGHEEVATGALDKPIDA